MTYRQRILLDRWLAVPLSVVCNAAVRGLGLIFSRDHVIRPATTRTIVVSKFVGMGSIIQATPLLCALKQQFPNARLIFVTVAGNRDLVARLPAVDEVVTLDDRGVVRMAWTTLTALARLIRCRVDHYFDLEIYSGFACLFAVFSLARNRFGFYRHSNRFKSGIYTHLVYFNTRMPVRRLYLQLGRLAGVPADAPDELGRIRVEASDRASLQAKLRALGMPAERYVLVNPNASDLLIERRWPVASMVRTVTELARLGHNVVLLGAPSEVPYVRHLCSQVAEGGRIFNTAGQLTIGEALAAIEGAACVLTNDTGPMHMAFALQRPTVCLFGPVDPAHYSMRGANIVTFYAPVPCSPCVHEIDRPPCAGNNICMQRLLPEPVIRAVVRQLAGAPASGDVAQLPLVWDGARGEPLGVVIRPWTNYQ